jgi:CheY-like chemotaxis protein
VAVAQNGVEAVEFSRLTNYDAILMDCQMPEMDGYEATGLIRKREEGGRRTPIIALTANDRDEHRRKCKAAGMDDFLAKPVNAEQLLKTLRQWIDWRVDAETIPNQAPAQQAD